MLDDFPCHLIAAGHPDAVDPQREDLSRVQRFGRRRLEDVITHE
jgi:hypothetical protein